MSKKNENKANKGAKSAKKPMSRESKILLLVILIVVAAVLGWRMWRNSNAEKNAAELAAALEETIMANPVDGVITVDGHDCAALLEMISLDLKLPVLTEYTEEAVKTAPAVLKGTVGQPGLVIGGSDYSSHFGQLTELFLGDLVWITGTDGTLYEYEIEDLELRDVKDISKLDTEDWDLILFMEEGTDSYILAYFNRTEY